MDLFVTQSGGDNIVNQVLLSRDAVNPAGPFDVMPNPPAHIEDTGSSAIYSLNDSFRQDTSVSGQPVVTSYDVAWAQFDTTTGTYDVAFQIFGPPDANSNPVTMSQVESSANVAPTNPLSALHFTGLPTASPTAISDAIAALPAWEFRAGGGAYVLAFANQGTATNPSFNLTGQAYNLVQFEVYQTNGAPNTSTGNISGYTIQPDLSHYTPGATNHITQQEIPSVSPSAGQQVQQLGFAQFSAATGNE